MQADSSSSSPAQAKWKNLTNVVRAALSLKRQAGTTKEKIIELRNELYALNQKKHLDEHDAEKKARIMEELKDLTSTL